MGQKIIVTPAQTTAINKILKSDDGSQQQEELVLRMVKDAKVDRSVAERYISSWRLNHPEINYSGAKLFIESNLIEQPKEHSPTAKEPKKSGAVAQIKDLAKQGKTVAEIISMGYNKNTVYRRVGEYNKEKKMSK